ncbi:LysR substrate-binding domain-containing protein [Shewanella gelidii]|uniref:LysR family transcriptional regulator n=1 Tax=Shewanella gelidii TaxID=1642821 RepID=A0A917JW86_9GAMM|nr:LysR substrate-binding domain-containing protein [Shewanella gelidii]MCL1098987.1 LysR substrate-binding domain-containing protein [Shewanella gelidii]GGI89067.1 LysR family transcriptional regulator [Shewanella gelidii]
MYLWQGVYEFVHVAQQQSFTVAAQKLDISTAQVSRQINALERRLGTKLLYRTTRKVSLTNEGQIYLQHCQQIITSLEEAERALGNLQDTPQGTIKLTAPVAYGEQFILPKVHDFLECYPDVNVQTILTNKQLDIVEGGFDLAIRIGQLADSTHIAKAISTRTNYTCASAAYIHQFGIPETIHELSAHDCLAGTHPQWHFKNEHGKKLSYTIKSKHSCNSGRVLRDAALKGLGVVQLPDYYVGDDIANGQLVEVLAPFRATPENIWAVYPHTRHLSAKVRRLVEHLQHNLNGAT